MVDDDDIFEEWSDFLPDKQKKRTYANLEANAT